jgi:hypothetical protein
VKGEPPIKPRSRFEEALVYAAQVHAEQTRKGTQVTYAAHLLGVCALVLEDGGSEDEALAALLHDAPEDQGGRGRLEDIRRRFGERVRRSWRRARTRSRSRGRPAESARRRSSPASTRRRMRGPCEWSWRTSCTTGERSWPTTGKSARGCGSGSAKERRGGALVLPLPGGYVPRGVGLADGRRAGASGLGSRAASHGKPSGLLSWIPQRTITSQ